MSVHWQGAAEGTFEHVEIGLGSVVHVGSEAQQRCQFVHEEEVERVLAGHSGVESHDGRHYEVEERNIGAALLDRPGEQFGKEKSYRATHGVEGNVDKGSVQTYLLDAMYG